MYQLYCILKEHDGPPTPTEMEVACAKHRLDGQAKHDFLAKLNKSSENIKKAFQDQQARAIVSDNLHIICLYLNNLMNLR